MQAEGSAKPSVLSMQLEAAAGRTLTGEEIEDMKGTAAIIYAAGAETVSIHLALASLSDT